ncbi:MAG: BLUF domain-containing protein [Dokdonella sp.]
MSMNVPSHGDEPMFGNTSPSLYNLVYCSRAADSIDGTEVDRIIESSRRHNPARGVTGLLVFGSGIFFQWLEGPRHSVLELMEVIKDIGSD